MDDHQLKTIIKNQLPKNRAEHTLRVTETALDLAQVHKVKTKQVQLAAMFHDYAKPLSKEKLKSVILSTPSLSKDLLNYHPEVWHGPVGSVIVKREYQIEDANVLNAIYYHTTGRKNMSDIELIVFIADYIEPGRDLPNLDYIRLLAKKDLHQAARMILKQTVQYLMNQGAVIHPDTFFAYNDLTLKLQNKESLGG